ncbi:MAG: c-type cytochrome [Hyphomicrobiales bacterium]|nr:c-type cytochrome [Hyphomicrobiales bacterium]
MIVPHYLQRMLGTLLAIVAAFAAAAVLVAWSGVYNIAASRGHWAVVEWFLTLGMRNSVALRARFVATPPPLDDADRYRLGAVHFHGRCTVCHAPPGSPSNPLAQRMLPPPPNLAHVAAQWSDRELFWIIKHGIKYTGMPAWLAQQRDDEVWSVAAFVRRLPKLDPEGYRALALGALSLAPQSEDDRATDWPSVVNACARCHGAGARRPPSRLVPVLHGQSRQFLIDTLNAFARGDRASGIMQPVAFELTPQAVDRLAAYYAGLARPPPAEPAAASQTGERGRVLARQGDHRQRIPACMDCHGEGAREAYPRLAGQNAAYMAARLRRWQAGIAFPGASESIMAPIARRLSGGEIDAVAAYFERLPQSLPRAMSP